MRGLGLNSEFGAYIESLPAITLASVNMMSFFGLHRRLRGSIAGHLAIYEMTSSIPNARYARGFRRPGFDSPVTDYDEHVEADAVHEQIAGRDLAGGLIEQDPSIAKRCSSARRRLAPSTRWWEPTSLMRGVRAVRPCASRK